MASTEQSSPPPTQEVGAQNSVARSVNADVFAEAAAAFHEGKKVGLKMHLGQASIHSYVETNTGIETIGSGNTVNEALVQTMEAMHH